MSDDRTLLEAAAKAAGLRVFDAYKYDGQWMLRVLHEDERNGHYPWAPFHDDRDAFRLAVKLRLELSQTKVSPERAVARFRGGGTQERFDEPIRDDPYAATRRCIVRAAAALSTPGEAP